MGSEKPPIVFDEENPEWTEEDFARARPGSEVLPEAVLAAFGKPRGRPRGTAKQSVTLRVDQDVLERFRAEGPGWQTRINAALRKAVGL
ncbi:BrnA antitoxin family protein [Sphingomonas morindae]|uniref:BrnA antitoxin family protein n=1 Tax=Sphingomonas morindae TaxID=1541170 RepID=A0ABY4X704_9SPHN|nr:BrnA antitoxin family protein [Sphingomonas morindae]USI72703.1 BrnA antitoxin family protein [Sphingomonas morindae]